MNRHDHKYAKFSKMATFSPIMYKIKSPLTTTADYLFSLPFIRIWKLCSLTPEPLFCFCLQQFPDSGWVRSVWSSLLFSLQQWASLLIVWLCVWPTNWQSYVCLRWSWKVPVIYTPTLHPLLQRSHLPRSDKFTCLMLSHAVMLLITLWISADICCVPAFFNKVWLWFLMT